MKQFLSRLSIVFVLLAVSFGSTAALAQYRHYAPATPRHYHSRSTADRVIRGIHTAETVADAAVMGYGIAKLADYTGLRLGYNSASLRSSGMNAFDSDNKPGVNLGLVFGWYLNSPVIIEPGVFYSMKGGKYSDWDVTMHMLEIPLVFKFDLGTTAGVHLQPFIGGFMAFGLGGDIEDSAERVEYDTFDCYDDFDAGLRMGCGLGLSNLYVELAYDLGLTNMAGYDSYGAKERTNTLSLNIGFNF